MKKFLIAAAAGLTLLSAVPLMAEQSHDNNGNKDDDKKMELSVSANATLNADPSCMQTAIKQRSDGIIAAFNAYNQSITSALKVQADAQVSAWAIVDIKQRQIALQAAERTFNASFNTAGRQLTIAKNAAKQHYMDMIKDCRGNHSSKSSSSKTSMSSSSVTSASSTSSVMTSQSSMSSMTSTSTSSVACLNTVGTFRGVFSMDSAVPDVGHTFHLTGAGNISSTTNVQLTGTLHSLGFIASGNATGDITLTKGSDTAVLHLVGPVQAGFSPLPTNFQFTVTSATGVFAGLQDGKAKLNIDNGTNGGFRIDFLGECHS